MTRDDADALLSTMTMIEQIPTAKWIATSRRWREQGIDVEGIMEALERLKPGEVLALKAFADRKIGRRRRS